MPPLQVKMDEDELWEDYHKHKEYLEKCKIPSGIRVTFWRHPEYPPQVEPGDTAYIRWARREKYQKQLKGKRIVAEVLDVVKTLKGDEKDGLHTIEDWLRSQGITNPIRFHDPPPALERCASVIVLYCLRLEPASEK